VTQDWDLATYWFATATESARTMADKGESTVVRIVAYENHLFSLKRATQVALHTE